RGLVVQLGEPSDGRSVAEGGVWSAAGSLPPPQPQSGPQLAVASAASSGRRSAWLSRSFSMVGVQH
ncbi:MAG: hypothetical protein ACR2QA_02295, partial [Solirubrobacteraceae bacterium]